MSTMASYVVKPSGESLLKRSRPFKQSTARRLPPRNPTQQDPDTILDFALAHESLYFFVQLFWNVIETKAYVDGWHIKTICEHLECVSNGSLRQLIINIPPRHTKSLIVGVFWPIWTWSRTPAEQFLFSSYSANLSIRDSVKARRLFSSPEFQAFLQHFHPDLRLTGDQNTKIRYENSLGGYRLATSVDGALTGEGGDTLVVDDPHNVREGESEATRVGVLKWWDESMSSRLNDARTGRKVIIMQRVHHQDLTGHILEREGKEWCHLCLPARYEGNRVSNSPLNFVDPRQTQGEPLSPERYNDAELTKLERSLGSYAAAGQLQQRPSPRGGGDIQASSIKVLFGVPNRAQILKSVRYWDKAGTAGGSGARTAGVLMHLMADQRAIVENVTKGRWSTGERENVIKQTAALDLQRCGRNGVEIWIEQEPGSGGLESAENTVKNLKGFDIHKETVSGDKVLRSRPFAAYVENGNVACVSGEWVSDYIMELDQFPVGRTKDQADASSGAFNKLCGLNTDEPTNVGVWGRKNGK